MTDATQIQWSSAACTDVGLVRRINEDACLDRPERGLWAVADGMGGHALGDVASRMVVDALDAIPAPDSLATFMADARDRLLAVNQQLREEAAARGAHIIGSTVVVLVAWDDQCGYLWAGDSRIYLYRDARLRRLTRDHSQIEELVSSGSISPEDAAFYPARNLITRAVGAAETLDIDADTIVVEDGDIFLLCSDGLSNEVSEQDMCSVLPAGDCRYAAQALIDMALQQGGRDNISVVLVRAEDLSSIEQTVLNPTL
ncbi:serine/threonine-protein phosphatase [Noviherbaspirillum cavernae]|uniref:Serine/threonine-protein phosphatase n=1 Tax=Noviherbaspirillum cavernae TaxID=2320862 RepID=A0A418WZ74_9BURK|nr:protein phosphatase 2C domain-containing protein [Noviherbaspirillum cavernae]RJG05537.1 serine/threonine-protein phosphatase [Noviherbaspirillum cavernae]